jgi:hypothetical protein
MGKEKRFVDKKTAETLHVAKFVQLSANFVLVLAKLAVITPTTKRISSSSFLVFLGLLPHVRSSSLRGKALSAIEPH